MAWATSASRVVGGDHQRQGDRGGPQPGRVELAKQIGVTRPWWPTATEVDAVKDLTEGKGADVVFDFVAEQGAGWDAGR